MSQSAEAPHADLAARLAALEHELAIQRQQLQEKKAALASAESDLENKRGQVQDETERTQAAEEEFRRSTESRVVAENSEYLHDWPNPQDGAGREELVARITEEEESRKRIERSIDKIARKIKSLSEEESDVRKRLVVVRLVTMLEDLQKMLKEKMAQVDEAAAADRDDAVEQDQARAQDLFKAIQELSREREWALMLQNKKNREISESIALKQERITQMEHEARQNTATLQRANDMEVFSVAERIQLERRDLLDEIERIRETNARLSDLVHDTRYVSSSGAVDRDTVMSKNAALGGTANPEEESLALRARIAEAQAERRRLQIKNAMLRREIDQDIGKYTEKISLMQKEIAVYQDECAQVEGENRELKAICDALASDLQ